jgi:LysM repeat protein
MMIQRIILIVLLFVLSACNLERFAAPQVQEANSTPIPTTAPSAEPVVTACSSPDTWQEYTVQRGDNLTAIANRYGTTVEELIAMNCLLSPNRLQVGQELYVPQPVIE